jgi:hypothetical protein
MQSPPIKQDSPESVIRVGSYKLRGDNPLDPNDRDKKGGEKERKTHSEKRLKKRFPLVAKT